MKLGKPVYDKVNTIYKCEVKEGFRCETQVEGTTFIPALDSFLPAQRDQVSQELITLTRGWFTKPLELQYVRERLSFSFPPLNLKEGFEGQLIWEATSLVISKTSFIFSFELILQKEAEKVVIEFPEEQASVPTAPQTRARHTPPASREEHKAFVMRERERAARYLFRAERLTQEYCQLYGSETDWEDSDEEDSDSTEA